MIIDSYDDQLVSVKTLCFTNFIPYSQMALKSWGEGAEAHELIAQPCVCVYNCVCVCVYCRIDMVL